MLSMFRRITGLLLAGLLFAACGQKGPLYLEGHVPKSQKKTKHMIDATPEPAPVVEPSAPN